MNCSKGVCVWTIMMGDLGRTVQPTQSQLEGWQREPLVLHRSSVSANSSQDFVSALFLLSPSEPNDFFTVMSGKSCFAPYIHPFPFHIYISQSSLQRFRSVSLSMLPSQYVLTVISFGLSPLLASLAAVLPFCSFLVPLSQLFSLVSVTSLCSFVCMALLLARRCMCWVLWPRCLGTRRALSCTGWRG